jgi:Flp pilus assembly protein TadD
MLLAVAFGLGLMSKPMIVTLPFLLLIVDFWPLRRPPNVREKLPLFAMSAVAAVITVTVQKGSGAVESLAAFPLQLRIENALVSYLVYIANTFWPVDLAVFYPFSSGIPIWQPLLGALFIIVISALVVAFRKHPYLAAGWFWYLGTLVPVIGLVQVGTQAHADRYMYVPMVGLAIMWVWSAADGKVPSIVAAALVLCCIPLTWVQAAYWQNSGTLFERALAVTSNNAIAEHNLGSYLLDQPGRLPDAIDHLKAALRINPDSASIHSDLGSAYAKSLDIDEAMHEFQEALRLNPNSTVVRNNLANARTQAVDAIYNKGIDLMHSGNLTGAINAFEEVIRLRPDYAEAENNLGVALSQIPSRASEARAHFGAAVKLDPNNAGAHFNLGVALAQTPGHTQEAIVQLEAAYRLHPDPEVQKAIAQLKGK